MPRTAVKGRSWLCLSSATPLALTSLHFATLGTVRPGPTAGARLATAPDDAFIMTAERWQALTAAADPAWQVLASATLRDKHMVVVGRAVR